MSDLEIAKTVFQAHKYTFVVVCNARVIATGTRDGIGELLDCAAQHGNALRGAALADKIVGKAVAMVAAYAGITKVYTPLASQAAQAVLQQHHIKLEAERMVPLIRNKRNDGLCPLEQLTMPLDLPDVAVAALREFVMQKRAAMPNVSQVPEWAR